MATVDDNEEEGDRGRTALRDFEQRTMETLKRNIENTPRPIKMLYRTDDNEGGGDQGKTALHLVALFWSEGPTVDELKDEPQVDSFKVYLERPLDDANAVAIARLLLAKGAKVDYRDRDDQTPLHFAASFSCFNMVSILLESGADANAKTSDSGLTPLCCARWLETAELLLANGAQVNPTRRYPSHHLPLFSAIRVIHSSERIQETHSISCYNQLRQSSSTANSRQMAELLLKNGARVDVRDDMGSTPLHRASQNDLHGVMDVLIKFGADINATDTYGNTTLHKVVRSVQQCLPTKEKGETIRLTLKYGVNVDAENDEGYTAIQMAVQSGKIGGGILALLEQNVEVFPQAAKHQSIEATFDEMRGNLIGRLIDASIKLRAAGLGCTRANLTVLAQNPRRDYFSSSSIDEFKREFHFGIMKDELELECAAEVEKMKNHMLNDTMSLHDFMLTDVAGCLFSKSLLDTLQSIDCGIYPIYENTLKSKLKELNLVDAIKERTSVIVLLRSVRANVKSCLRSWWSRFSCA